ncbi:MAG: enoyl-CoA hydratase-related protein [Dehalococcoidia bacterium]
MAVFEVQKEGKIVIITINRPEARNALNSEVRRGLNQVFVDFRDNPDLWVAILTGAGDTAFSAGADIKEFRPGPSAATMGEALRPDQIWKPFIAAINGYALGGGLELAMQCDIRLAAEHARLGQPEINIGFMPGAGGTQRLPRFVPRAMAAQILLLGEPIDAQEAYRIGLVNKVVPLAQLLPTAKQWAETICRKGPVGVRASKEAMIRGYDLSLNEGLKLERELANGVRMSEDFAEGTRAFVEKRPPQYKGK